MFLLSILLLKRLPPPPGILYFQGTGATAVNLSDILKVANTQLAVSLIPLDSNLLTNLSLLIHSGRTVNVFPNNTVENEEAIASYSKDIIRLATYDDLKELFTSAPNTTNYVVYNILPYHPSTANPFVPGVWNCFFHILLIAALVSWSMIHYSTIDVQRRFHKKNA